MSDQAWSAPGRWRVREETVRESESAVSSTDARLAVESLYLRTCPRLVGLLTAMGGSRSDAEEIAQDAYVALLKHWDRVRSYEDPEAWVRTVAIRKLISRHRRYSVQRVGLRRLVAGYEPASDDLSPDGVDLARALSELPLKLRTVVLLHYVLDQSVEQISTQLSLPTGTVKSRLARGRARLEPLLAEQEVFET